MDRARGWSRSKTLLLGLAALTTAGAIAGLGTFAAYSSSKGASADVTSGLVTIALGATGAKTNRFTANVTDLEPGDTYKRSFDFISSTTLLSSVTLIVTDVASGTKLSGTSSGLQLTLQRCSVAWTETGSGQNFAYSCSGATTTPVGPGNVLGTTTLTGLDAMNSGATLPTTDHFMATLALPTSSPSSAQSASSTITFTFSVAQLNTSARHR